MGEALLSIDHRGGVRILPGTGPSRKQPDRIAMGEPLATERGERARGHRDVADIPHNLHAWPLDPAVAALDTELRGQLERALAALPESLRTVFVLRELHRLSTEETAATLQLGESAVKVRLHRARLRLRELLADYLTA